MDLPRVFIVGNDQQKLIDIIEKLDAKLYLDQDNLKSFVLQIDNKYYKGEILLCVLKDWTKEFSTEGAEGLIIFEDLQKEDNHQKLLNWSTIVELLTDTEVRLLVCDSVNENSNKDKVLEWYTQNHFELIELECPDLNELQDLESEHNTFGISRVIEALHAHRWPNISLKEQNSRARNDVNEVSEQMESINLNSNDVLERLQMGSVLDGLMGDEDTDFGELFGQLRAMKEHAMSLPINERKNAAEALVMAFWKAMGGNELDEFS